MSLKTNATVVQLFLDVVSAFASLTRRIALPEDCESEELWRRDLLNTGLSDGEVDGLIDMRGQLFPGTMPGPLVMTWLCFT